MILRPVADKSWLVLVHSQTGTNINGRTRFGSHPCGSRVNTAMGQTEKSMDGKEDEFFNEYEAKDLFYPPSSDQVLISKCRLILSFECKLVCIFFRVNAS